MVENIQPDTEKLKLNILVSNKLENKDYYNRSKDRKQFITRFN